jgi:ABC-2 type transport system ATP-binding protein
MITVESVTRAYGDFTAVDDVSFTAQAGRVTGFLGPNGAGKSTTMRIIVGPTRATSGTARRTSTPAVAPVVTAEGPS